MINKQREGTWLLLTLAVAGAGFAAPAAAQAEDNSLSVLVDGLKQGGILVPIEQQCPPFWTGVAPDDVVTQNGMHFRICKLDPSFKLSSTSSSSTTTSSMPTSAEGAELQQQVMSWAGTYTTSFGLTHLAPNASRGDYAYNNGQIGMTYIDGSTIRGTWEQSTSSKQCADGRYYGQFVFHASPGGFTGNYGYCDDPPTAGEWNGTRQ